MTSVVPPMNCAYPGCPAEAGAEWGHDHTAPWRCPLCQGKGMLVVTYANGEQQIIPCYPQCVQDAGLTGGSSGGSDSPTI